MRASHGARLLIVGTAAVGGALLAAAATQLGSLTPAQLALFCAAAFVTELMVVPRDETSFDLRDTTSFSFSASVHIAAVLVLGPWAAALVAAFGVVAADGLRRRPPRQIVFNAAALALAAAAGGLTFQALGGAPGALSFPADFPALAALAVVVYAVNTLLVSAVVALESGMPFASTTRESLAGGLAASLGESGLGVTFALFALFEPWAIVALFPLVLAVYRSHERLVTLRRETARALEVFANVVDERDPYTYRHSDRVAEYVRSLGEALGLPARTVGQLRWAGRLHDLGKISVDAAVLRKPGKLDAHEWRAIRRHPRLSARLLRQFRFAGDQAKAVEYHHERADGEGYYGVDGAEVPLAAHFLVVADSFDAMTSDRPYRAGLPSETALAEIEEGAGTQFHPLVARAFVALQRGLDPVQELSPEELREIRRGIGPTSASGARLRFAARSQWTSAAAVVAALLLVGAGLPWLAVPALGLASAGFALHRLDVHRGRRLAAALRRALAQDLPPPAAIARVAAELERACELRWAGLVSWIEREGTGSVELEWHAGASPPTDTALASWFLREAESSRELLLASGAELGREHAHAALPLRRDGELAGYLVLALAGPLARPLAEALTACADDLADGLVGPAGEVAVRPLRAVAS